MAPDNAFRLNADSLPNFSNSMWGGGAWRLSPTQYHQCASASKYEIHPLSWT